MKIAIAATSSETEAQISTQGARAAYYLFYDTESGLIEAFSNPVSQSEKRFDVQGKLIISDLLI